MITISTPTFTLVLNDETQAEVLRAFFGGLNRSDIRDAIDNSPDGMALATSENIEWGWNFVGEVYGQLLERNK
jgi:hypothetical protein